MNGGGTAFMPRGERGAAMLAALCLAIVFALCLSSYIALCYGSLRMSTRNQMGAHSLEIAEMGVEQALYAVNANNGNGDWTGGWYPAGAGEQEVMAVTANGLVPVASNPTPLNLGSGTTAQVTISVSPVPVNTPITITSTAAITLASDPNSAPVVRTVTVTGAIAPVFVNAVAATTGAVQFQSGGVLDSYDSRLGAYSVQNPSLLPGFLGSSAVVLSQDTSVLSATVALNNTALYGYAVGNQTNSISYNMANAYVGAYPTSTTNIDPTRLITNPPPVAPPYPIPYPYALPYQPTFLENLPTLSVALPLGACSGGNVLSQTYTLGSTTATSPTVYNASGINLTAGATVTIQGPVVLIVSGNVNISGGQILLATALPIASHAAASLTIFLENGSMTLGDNGIVNTDANPLPKHLAILSTNNTNTSNSVQISTNTPICGAIYFPYLPITVTGTTPTFYGSIVGQSVTFSTSTVPTIHYDMALRFPDSLLGDSAFTYLYSPVAAGNLYQTVGP
jgi:hypothetical protein